MHACTLCSFPWLTCHVRWGVYVHTEQVLLRNWVAALPTAAASAAGIAAAPAAVAGQRLTRGCIPTAGGCNACWLAVLLLLLLEAPLHCCTCLPFPFPALLAWKLQSWLLVLLTAPPCPLPTQLLQPAGI